MIRHFETVMRGGAVALALAVLSSCSTEGDGGSCATHPCYTGYCIVENGQAVCKGGPNDGNDTAGTATALTPSSEARTATYDFRPVPDVDVDFYSFQAGAGHVYRIACYSPEAGCELHLRDAADQPLAESRDASRAGVVRELPPGRYVFSIQAAVRSKLVEYQLVLEDLGPDDHGDTRVEATPRIPSPEPITGRAEDPEDVEVFSFPVTSGHLYQFDCSGLTREWALSLEDSAGVGIDASANHPAYKQVGFTATREGRAFAVLRTFGGKDLETYSCKLEDLGLDDHGNTPQTATVLVPGEAGSPGEIQARMDVDLFRVDATEGHLYRFQCSSSAVSCEVSLYAGAGATKFFAPDLPLGTRAWVFETTAGGAYYLAVSGPVGLYSYGLEDLGRDEYGNTLATASVLTPGVSAADAVEWAGDKDFFTFDPVQGTLYRISLTPRPLGGGMNLSLRALPGLQALAGALADDGQSYRLKQWTNLGYTVEVYGNSGSYTLLVEVLGTDDFPDHEGGATPITLSTAVSGQFETEDDVDAFVITLPEDRVYTVDFAGGNFPLFIHKEGELSGIRPSPSFPSFQPPAGPGRYYVSVGAPVLEPRIVPYQFTLR